MYKIIQNNKVIDVVQNPRFVRFLTSGHIALTDKSSAQGIAGSNGSTLYSFKPRQGYPNVTIQEITLEEFNSLQGLLNSGEEPAANKTALMQIKQEAIECLSEQCKEAIISGFSIKLPDGENYKFSLTLEDQLNLMNLENQLNSGAKTFIYHATGMPCRVFTRNEIALILKAFRKHVTYHTTYFNAAKQYINSLVSIKKVKTFTYGTDITAYVDDPTLKQILKNGGSN
jgi:hypothetical protein